MTMQKVPVSERALLQRINRKLDTGFVVKKAGGQACKLSWVTTTVSI
jgi:hypothetical protein